MQHLDKITDEQLKQEDRKTMQDMTKALEVLLQAAKLPDAIRALDDFALALALKCMRSQNLEKLAFLS